MPSMPRPFEAHIAHYPGEPLEGVVNAENSLFQNRAVVDSVELFNAYASPSQNAKGRSDILTRANSFCFSQENYDVFMLSLSSTLDSTNRPHATTDKLKIRRYEELYTRLDEAFINNDFIGPSDIEAEIPPAVTTEHPELKDRISTANNVLRDAFPTHFGIVIPEIVPQDIVVSTDQDVMRFQKQDSRFLNHPFSHQAFETYSQETGSKKLGLYGKTSNPMIQVLSRHPEKPIIWPLGDLEATHPNINSSFRECVLDFNVVRSLIHENFHRTVEPTNPIPVSQDDDLFRQSFGTDEIILASMKQDNDPKTESYEKMLNSLKEFASSNNPHVVIDGARVQMWCTDENGRLRVLTESGYDLNEAIVEALTYSALPRLLNYVKDKHPDEYIQKCIDLTNKMAQSNLSYLRKNILADVAAYLKEMGINTPAQTLEAYSQTKIPTLHATTYPNEHYIF